MRRLPFIALFASVSLGAANLAAQAPGSADQMPAVAVVSQTGQLLPLAAYADGSWKLLGWPGISSAYDLRRAPLVPATIDAIPRDWFTPLKALPASWRLQILNGQAREIHVLAPARWDDGTAWSIGIRVDYRVRESGEEFDAGIAVAGAAAALPVRRLDQTSAEWRAIVRSHASAFGAAERTGRARSGPSDPVPDDEELSKELSKADVDLREIRVGRESAYYYFSSRLLRPSAFGRRDPACGGTIGIHVGLLSRRGNGPFAIEWIRGRSAACAEGSNAVEIVGGVKVGDEVRFVVKRGGDDWTAYAIADPEGPQSALLSGPLPSRQN